MECSWQAYYVTPKLMMPTSVQDTAKATPAKQTKKESQPLLDRDVSSDSSTASCEGSYFSALMGTSLKAHMDVAQYGLHLVKCFSNLNGDITGYVATDNCKFLS